MRCFLAIAAATLMGAIARSALAVATTAPAIAGLWVTPGHNVIEITAGPDGALQGKVVKAAANDAFAFKVGELVVDKVVASGRDVSFTIAFRDEGTGPAHCPDHFAPFHGTISEDGETIEGTAGDFDFLAVTDATGKETGCKVQEKAGDLPYQYKRPPLACSDPTPRQGFAIAAGPHRKLSIKANAQEPLGDENQMIDVQVSSLDGTPVGMAKVRWHVSRQNPGIAADFFTETDETGTARLQFGMLPEGDFAPTEQMTKPALTLPAGTYDVQASVPDLGLSLSDTLSADLGRTGALVEVTDSGGNPIDSIVLDASDDTSAFRIKVVDFASYPDGGRPASVTVSLSAEGITPVAVTMTGTGGLYQENKSFVIYRGAAPHGITDALSQHVVRVTDAVTSLRIFVGEVARYTDIAVYDGQLARAKAAIRNILDKYVKIIADVKGSAKNMTPAQAQYLDAKSGLVARAKAVLDAPSDKLKGMAGVVVAQAYLDLLQSRTAKITAGSGGMFQFVTNPYAVSTFSAAEDYFPLPYSSQAELAALRSADKKLERTTDDLTTNVVNGLVAQLQNGPQSLKMTLETLVAAPAYSFYVLVWGTTIDGEDADALDRVFAGIDLAQFVLQSPPSVQIGKRLALKRAILERVEAFAARYGLKLGGKGEPLMLERDFRVARLSQRMEAAGDAIIARLYNANLSAEVKDSVRASLERIANSKVAANLRARLVLAAESSAVPNIRRDIGLLEHWTKQQESTAYWENEIRRGRAESAGAGRYRALEKAADGAMELGKHEELVEWTIPGSRKRIDTGLINHVDQTVCIIDRAAQLDPDHLAKGQQYVEMVSKSFPGYAVKYFEYYWDEKAGDFVLGTVAHY